MYILAIETTGARASVAIIDKDGRYTEKSNDGMMNHLKDVMPMISSFDISRDEIDAVAVSAGPGSYTGIRIGVSAARGIAQGLNIPVISVPTLEAFCYGDEKDGIICPMLDARRGNIYGGAYRWEKDKLLEVIPGDIYPLGDFLDMLPQEEKITVYGDAYRKYGETIFERDLELSLATAEETGQRAYRVARAGLEKYNAGQTEKADKVLPIYMRKAEAEIKREERLKNEDKKGIY